MNDEKELVGEDVEEPTEEDLESLPEEAEIEEAPFNEELADELAAAGELEVKSEPEEEDGVDEVIHAVATGEISMEEAGEVLAELTGDEPEAEGEEIVALSEDGAAVEHIESETLETVGAESISEEESEELVKDLMGDQQKPSDPSGRTNRPGARRRGGPKNELAKDESASVRIKRIQQDNS